MREERGDRADEVGTSGDGRGQGVDGLTDTVGNLLSAVLDVTPLQSTGFIVNFPGPEVIFRMNLKIKSLNIN